MVVGPTSWEPDRADETAAQVDELQRLVTDGAAHRVLPSLLLADLNYDRDQPPLAGFALHDGWESADPGGIPPSDHYPVVVDVEILG